MEEFLTLWLIVSLIFFAIGWFIDGKIVTGIIFAAFWPIVALYAALTCWAWKR